jgi:hypothetical protein
VTTLRTSLAFIFAVGLLLVSACSSPHSAQDIAESGGLDGAKQKTQVKSKGGDAAVTAPSSSMVVGTIAWVNTTESLGTIQTNANYALPEGTVLVVRDGNMNPVSLVRVTSVSRGRNVGIFLLAGTPQTGQEVAIPGPEYKPLLDLNIDQNNSRAAAQAFQAAGTADPMIIPGQ